MVKNPRRVLLYGDSLILEGVRTSLKDCPGIEIILLDKSMKTPSEAIREFCPAVFVFDLGEVHPEIPVSVLQEPALLVGIDQDTRKALVWSGRQASAFAAADLLEIICPGYESSNFIDGESAEVDLPLT